MVGYLFLQQLENYALMLPELRSSPVQPGLSQFFIPQFYGAITGAALLVIPLLTMRSFSDDQGHTRLNLLLAAPLSSPQIVIGKFVAVAVTLAVLLSSALLLPLSLRLLLPIDLGMLLLAFVTVYSFGLSCAAIGLLASAWFRQQAAAAAASFAIILMLWVAAGLEINSELQPLLRHLALPSHLAAGLSGIWRSADYSYFGLLIGGCLSLSGIRLYYLRAQG